MLLKSILALALVVACSADALTSEIKATKRQSSRPNGGIQNGQRRSGGGVFSQGKQGIGTNPVSKLNVDPNSYGQMADDTEFNRLTKRQSFSGRSGGGFGGGGAGGKRPGGGDKSNGNPNIGSDPKSMINIDPNNYGRMVDYLDQQESRQVAQLI